MRTWLKLLVVLAACGDSSEPGDAETTAGDASTGATTTTMSMTTAMSTSTSSATSTTMEPSSSSESSGSEATTMAPDQACGLEDLKAGEANPIVSGTRAMQLPPDIGEILHVSCGCHLADELTADDAPDYAGPFAMATWDGWQATNTITGMPYYMLAQEYLTSEFMPLQPFCNVDGEAMDPDNRATLLAWLGEDAPDGATWVP